MSWNSDDLKPDQWINLKPFLEYKKRIHVDQTKNRRKLNNRSHFLVRHTLEVEVNVIVVVIYFVIGLCAIYTIESLFYANVDILWFFAGSRLVKCSSSSTGKFVFMSILWVSFTASFWALHLKGGMPVATRLLGPSMNYVDKQWVGRAQCRIGF